MKLQKKRTLVKKPRPNVSYTTTGNVTIPMGGTIGSGSGTTYTINTGAGVGGISGGAGQVFTTTGTGYQWAQPLVNSNGASIQVKGDAEFDGNVKIKGHDIVKLLEKMEDRLAILMEPNPEKLKKFQALKKAYDNYKLMEKLCIDENEGSK